MKSIYTDPTKEAARADLNDFKKKWNSMYSYVIIKLVNNRDVLTVFYGFHNEIRKIITLLTL